MEKTETEAKKFIYIKGARLHNLKNIDVYIPRNKLVVITGLSGSGKSTLAFDTLYAEGQRRYVESLSAYARQFLGRMNKPEVDFIKGISPAIAIQQKVISRNPRSTVGTSTEIYDYLKLLFARIGKTYSPVSGKLVKRHTVEDVTKYLLSQPAGSRYMILSKMLHKENRSKKEQLDLLLAQGFTRVVKDDQIMMIEEVLKKKVVEKDEIYILIDRIGINPEDPDQSARIADSVQTAFFEGEGECFLLFADSSLPGTEKSKKKAKKQELVHFSNRFELDGMKFEEPDVNFFSFNNPVGACKRCEGFGNIIGIDEDLVIPDKSLSVYNDAVACWRSEAMSEWKSQLIKNAHKSKFPVHKPVMELNAAQKKMLWEGSDYHEGLDDFFRMLEQNIYKIQYRVMLSRYRGKTVCPECKGSRLRADAGYVQVNGKSINELVMMPVSELQPFFETVKLDQHQAVVGKRLLTEIRNRLRYLGEVGLGYLTLNRLSNSLSGGESQRINLATSLGSSLVGSMYILDEPSIGLHPRDTTQLIKVLKSLRDLGNTVIVVEHDEEVMRASDEIIDIGPGAGSLGGELVFQGNSDALQGEEKSLTARFLNGKEKIPVPSRRRKWNNSILVKGATENNLKNINVKFPLNTLTVVTGVSGSGKSSLVRKVLYPALKKHFGGAGEQVGRHSKIEGNINRIEAVEMVDQNPIGKSSRSNPVTYVKAFDDIRNLFAEQQLARMRGYKPSHFSFNVEGGRCDVCEGEGEVIIEMQFMADIHLPCDSCSGTRYKQDTLEILFEGKNISDVLGMTVDDALAFFSQFEVTGAKRVAQKLVPLQDVGLGYVQLGQSSSTLSGGEAQRIKLASFIGLGSGAPPTLFIFDEPTTGLHFHDIQKLLAAFTALIDQGHSITVIEHNSEVIKCADWVIDLGPEGGDSGGNIVFEGTPEDLLKCKGSYTGKYLKGKI